METMDNTHIIILPGYRLRAETLEVALVERTEVRPDNDMMVPIGLQLTTWMEVRYFRNESIEFSRPSSNGNDWYFEENQDRIKPDIWITRHDQYPLFNAYNQSPYQGSSPSGTAWAEVT